MNHSIEPDVFRQRLLLEGHWNIDLGQDDIDKYLRQVASHLDLRIYCDPIIYSPGGKGKEENQGYDAFVPLIDSGISAYFWTSKKFFSIVLYTCKGFDEEAAASFTRKFFEVEKKLHTLSF